MNTGDVVLLLSLFGTLGTLLYLSRYRLLKWFGRDILVESIYLRSSGDLKLLKLKISNDSGHTITINNVALVGVNDKAVREIGATRPFEIEDKKYGFWTIKFEGELRKGKNNVEVILAVEEVKGRRRLVKKLSATLDQD